MAFRFYEVYVVTGYDGRYNDLAVGVVEFMDTLGDGTPHTAYKWLSYCGSGMGGHVLVGDIVREEGGVIEVSNMNARPDSAGRYPSMSFTPLTIEGWQQLMADGHIPLSKGEMFTTTSMLRASILADILEDDWGEGAG